MTQSFEFYEDVDTKKEIVDLVDRGPFKIKLFLVWQILSQCDLTKKKGGPNRKRELDT